MDRKTVSCLVIFTIIHISTSSFVFHENTNIMFTSKYKSNDYFGYSTLLTDYGLLVGAPKAKTVQTENRNRRNGRNFILTTGTVFLCSLRNLNERQSICKPLGKQINSKTKWYFSGNLESNAWFGSDMAMASNHRLLVTAPRQEATYNMRDGSLHGACYFLTSRRNGHWKPFEKDKTNRKDFFVIDERRPTYGTANTSLYYYTFGLAGFSMAVTKMDTVILGAPGLMQLAGGIVSYSFNPNDTDAKSHPQPIANPYYTMDIEMDEYFGYSVDSGVFEKSGRVYYIGGAPRAYLGRGKVLIIEPPTAEKEPLNITVKLVGPQVGSYFGASLCCTDINNDGLDDLLVGAPTFVKQDGALPYDQGAVFIYIAKEVASGFVLEESGYVSGSGVDGARFGTTIADLGDINGDDFRDIAIGAPYENNGVGAVYIYMGNAYGLNIQNVQRIQPVGAQGFGWSISKGFDVDGNKCNDVAVGAYDSSTSYLYRCVPTIPVRASIRVSQVISLPSNITTFTTMFCVSAPPIKLWPNLKLNLTGRIQVDPMADRATLIGDSEYNITIAPANELCNERTIEVNLTADLLRPILLTFEVEAHELLTGQSTTFIKHATRLSDSSTTEVSQLVQVLIDCGDDLVCNPWLNVTLKAMDNPYVPGTNNKFGVLVNIVNEAEPAYGVKVNINLPSHPKRIPSECLLKDLQMICDLPQPFLRNDSIEWEVEMEYDFNITRDLDLVVSAKIISELYTYNITKDDVNTETIEVTPEATFSISGQSVPITSMIVFRDSFNEGANISFKHFYKIYNSGPSDWYLLVVKIIIPDKTYLSKSIEGCDEKDSQYYVCTWSVPANSSIPVSISLQMDLSESGDFLESKMNYIAVSSIFLDVDQFNTGSNYTTCQVSTTLILEQASIAIWYIVVPCIFFGLFLLSVIIWILYKRNFFVRTRYDQLKQEQESSGSKDQNDVQFSEDSPSNLLEEDEENVKLSQRHSFEMDI